MEMRVKHERLVQILIKEGYKVFTWGGPVFGGLSRGIVLISEKLRTGFAMRYDFVNALSKVGLPINWYTQEDFCYESVENN
ncbi:hypothetical protein KJA16_01685 [Patescibacteria group bacterium]|nr:hypothetical protein [Patescibacteria group bacterium]